MSQDRQFPCSACGANLTFTPGAERLDCPYCGAQTPIPLTIEAVEELDFQAALAHSEDAEDLEELDSLTCPSCAASIDRPAHVTSLQCCYCDTPIVDETRHEKRLRPKSLLPFHINQAQAQEHFKKWIAGLWFAPNEIRQRALRDEGLHGVYVPYWTYDSHVTTSYTGERGEDYWATETYTAHENGKTVTKTRQVRKTRWYSARGVVGNCFDDVLVLGSRSLPAKQACALEPWDLKNLVPYQQEYLSGFRSERYQVDLEEGFTAAKGLMDPTIRATIRSDIGGDRQRIHSTRSTYRNITFKHVLLPIWITAFRFDQKVFRVLVNARTGEVQGERPYSWIKIVLAVVAAVAVVGLLVLMFNGF